MQNQYPIVEPKIYKREESKGAKRLMKTKPPQPLPMKVADLNSMVQIRKKKPRMKFTEKQAYREQQERQIASQ